MDELFSTLGLNSLEAEVYIKLLSSTPITAYKIGKLLNKPTANVYKAIDSLASKGAVIIEENKNKQCKAVPPDEFLNHYEKNFIEKTNIIKKKLSELNVDVYDERTYSLFSVSLIFERFKTMMQKCKVIAVIDIFPKPLEKVIDIIRETALRGIDIHLEVYQPVEIEGVNITLFNPGNKVLEHWKSQQLNLIIDGEEHLIALMDNDITKIHQATWSNNLYKSCILHAGAIKEQTVTKIMSEIDKPDFEQNVKNILKEEKFFFNSDIPGFNKLFERNINTEKYSIFKDINFS